MALSGEINFELRTQRDEKALLDSQALVLRPGVGRSLCGAENPRSQTFPTYSRCRTSEE